MAKEIKFAQDTRKALELGAEGIGLCRTEHMFFDENRIAKIRKMILSETVEAREAALNELIPFQKGDFKAMYKELKGLPMTVRYLDPPLHEFLPTLEEDIKNLANENELYFADVPVAGDEIFDIHFAKKYILRHH